MDWSVREGYSWVEDKYHCEEQGRLLNANATEVPSNVLVSTMVAVRRSLEER